MTDTQTTDSKSAEAVDTEPAAAAVQATVDAYFGMWNEPDPTSRIGLIRRAWVAEGKYLDPKLEAAGHDGLSEMVAGVHALFPGHRFRPTSGIDLHHDRVRFGWELVGPDGTITVAGLDVGLLDAEGRLMSLTGFFGDLPVR